MIAPNPIEVVNEFFRFRVDGMPDCMMLVHLSEVRAIIDKPVVSPVPFAPAYVYGVTCWNDHIVTIIDLAAALLGQTASADSADNAQQLVIVSLPNSEHLAWPIASDAGALSLPLSMAHIDVPVSVRPDLVYGSFLLDEESYLILHMSKL